VQQICGHDPNNPRLVISSEARNLLLSKIEEQQIPRRFAPRNDKKKVRGRIPRLKSKLPEKERVQAAACTLPLTTALHGLNLKFAGNTVSPESNISTASKQPVELGLFTVFKLYW